VLIGYSWLFACEDGFTKIFVGAGHALRLQLGFFKKFNPFRVVNYGRLFIVWRFDPFRVSNFSI